MTTIAAIQGKGWCVVGSDSRATTEAGQPADVSHVGKVFKNGPTLIAAAGSSRGCNILQFGWTAPSYGTTSSTDHYITRKFIPSMRQAFLDGGFEPRSTDKGAEVENEILVAVKGVLYRIFSDYGWERCRQGLYAVGSGEQYALAAMDVLGGRTSPRLSFAQDLVRYGVECAIRWDVYSGGEVQIFVQKA